MSSAPKRKPAYLGDHHAKRPDPIELAWKKTHPKVPFPDELKGDRGGILRRNV